MLCVSEEHSNTHTPYLLLSLDGVHWSHIITGNVSAATGGERASIPPVPFTERERELGEGERDFVLYQVMCFMPQNAAKKELEFDSRMNTVHLENL